MNRQRMRRLALGVGLWVAGITALQLGLNVEWSAFANEWLAPEARKLNIAYIPVT